MLYRFGAYTLDPQCYELRHLGLVCPLEPQVFALLHYLIAHRTRVVTRQELLDHIWAGRFVSNSTLDHRLMQARQAIGDSSQTQRSIQTLRSRGYRFIALSKNSSPPQPSLPPPLSPSPPLFSPPRLPRLSSSVVPQNSPSYTSGTPPPVRGSASLSALLAKPGSARPPWWTPLSHR